MTKSENIYTFVFWNVLKVVSSDGKKVRRKHLFTERDKEELQVLDGKLFIHHMDALKFF